MIPESHKPLYAHAWPLFWPWLWLQLWRLAAWQRRTGRDLLVTVDRWGNVHVRAVGDAKMPGRWRYDAPAMPAWARPALGSDVPEDVLDTCVPAPAAVTGAAAPGLACAPARPAPLYLNFDTS